MVLEEGQITEAMYDKCGFPQDKGFDGKVYLRPDGTDRVPMQRAKFINAAKQNEYEKEKRRKEAEDKLAADHLAYDRVEAKLKENRAIASVLLAHQGSAAEGQSASNSRRRRGNQRALSSVSISTMMNAKIGDKKISIPQWKKFIHVRRYETERRPKNDPLKIPSNLWPPGGAKNRTAEAIQECIDRDEAGACLYSLAFSLLSKPVLLKSLPTPASMESIAGAGDQDVLIVEVDSIEAPSLVTSFPSFTPSAIPNVSDWFSWTSGVISEVNEGSVDAPTLANADQLYSLMKTRHLIYERTELTAEEIDKLAAQICMLFERENLHYFALLHAAFKQVKSDLRYESEATSLVRKDDNTFIKVTGVNKGKEGIYIYLDVINKTEPRVGKTNGKNGPSEKATFGGRDDTHAENAKKKALEGGFYSKYPSVEAENVSAASMVGGGRRETHLRQHIVFAFDRNSMTEEQKSKLLPNKPDSSVFVWSKPVMDYLEAYGKRNNIALANLQFTLLNYGLEHSSKLLLAKEQNVSNCKGFEAFMIPRLAHLLGE